MGDVIVEIKVMPESTETDLDRIKGEVMEKIGYKIIDAQKKPIAFGLSSLNLKFLIPDEGGILSEITEKIERIQGVESTDVVSVSRALG